MNVLAALARLGKRTAFIGKVGSDPFGYFLRDTLEQEGIDSQGLVFTDLAHTTMAFVHLGENGERSFHFCRQPGAEGSYYRTRTTGGSAPAYSVAPVDTTGAGDGFMGSFLHTVLENSRPVSEWTDGELRRALAFANAAGALATTRRGAIASLAAAAEIEELVKGVAIPE